MQQGYTASYIKDLLHTSYTAIRKYKKGDPKNLCKISKPPSEQTGILEEFKEYILNQLTHGVARRQIHEEITKMGSSAKKTCFNEFCRKLIEEFNIETKENSIGVLVKADMNCTFRYIKRSQLLKYVYTGKGIDGKDVEYLLKYSDKFKYISKFKKEFNEIFVKKDTKLLDEFIDKYKQSEISKIASFARGLLNDIDAIKNAVILTYSNGFVEGTNSKLKMIKKDNVRKSKVTSP